MKADSAFSENSQLTIFTTKYGGYPFDDVPLLCTLCALSMFFEISSLVFSGKTLDIWSISTDLMLDKEFPSACWYLMFSNIRVFLRDLFFSTFTSLSNSLIVSNWFSHFVFSFQTLNCLSHHCYCISFGVFCFLFYLFHLDVYLSGGDVKLLLNWNRFFYWNHQTFHWSAL